MIGEKTKLLWQDPEYRNYMKEAHKKQHNSPSTEFKMGNVPWNKGTEMSEDVKNKLRLKLSWICPHGALGKSKCKLCRKTQLENWLLKHPTYNKDRAGRRKEYSKKYMQDHKEKYYQKRLVIREEVIRHYTKNEIGCQGFNGMKCKYNITDISVLTIDHINGGGSKHIKEIKGNLYRWLKLNNFPEGYQVLCWNCQFLKRVKNKENRWRYANIID